MSFIKEIIQELAHKSSNQWGRSIFLFPSKRPCLMLKKELSEQIQETFWAPQCWAIADFLSYFSSLKKADNMALVLELYQCYLDIKPQQTEAMSLRKFFPLGETLLSDFSDLDRDLVDADTLFNGLSQLHLLDKKDFLDQEQRANIRTFWKHFSAKEPMNLQREFLELWSLMGRLYTRLNEVLLAKNWAYTGLAEKHLVQEFDRISAPFKDKEIYVCGFNALTKAEISLFKKMEDIAEVYYYFDADQHILRPECEAGHFIRKNAKILSVDTSAFSDLLSKEEKTLDLTAASGISGMAQALYYDLAAETESTDLTNTGIILPDENALLLVGQLLSKLPHPINITMGWPMINSAAWALCCAYMEMRLSYRTSDATYNYREILRLLAHEEIQQISLHEVNLLKASISNDQQIRCSIDWLTERVKNPFLQQLFKIDTANSGISPLLDFCQKIESHIPLENPFFRDCLVKTYQFLTQFNDIFSPYFQESTLAEQWHLVQKAAKNKRMAFEGGAGQSLQLMGLLESRSLDFDRLYLLSANEGILPKRSRHSSLIPFTIRKAFGMNTFKEDDAMSAYYFYRLLKRSNDIHVYYNTDTGGESKGELSRFLMQIEEELPLISITKKTFQLATSPPAMEEDFILKKSPSVMESLRQYECIAGENKRALSPSALVGYMKSEINFYLRYVANFSEEQEMAEDIDPIILGNIVHLTMEKLYENHLNIVLTQERIDSIQRNDLDTTLSWALEKEMKMKTSLLMGKNYLLYQVARRLCITVLNNDAAQENLIIRRLEYDELYYDLPIITAGGNKVIRLKGQFDRVDELAGQLRVVDYKTGTIKIPKSKFFERCFSSGDYGASLQILFYSLVYLKNHPEQSVVPIIYELKGVDKPDKAIGNSPFQLADLEEFEELLKEKLSEIWDSDIPFVEKNNNMDGNYLIMDIL